MTRKEYIATTAARMLATSTTPEMAAQWAIRLADELEVQWVAPWLPEEA